MNEELILKERSEGVRLLVESNLEDLESLTEIIATEVIRFQPGPENLYFFIYRLLEAMVKTEDAIKACDQADVETCIKNCSASGTRPHILEYYMKESIDNYFRSGLKKPLVQVPGCTGCVSSAPQDETVGSAPNWSEARRCNTVCDLSSTLHPPVQQHTWETRQSWHSLQFPESLETVTQKGQAEEKGSQGCVDDLDEEIPLETTGAIEASACGLEEVAGLDEPTGPTAPPSSPRKEDIDE